MRLQQLGSFLATASLFAAAAAVPRPGGPGAPKEHEVTTKYFFEPGGDDLKGHYDIRYYKDVVSYEEREETLHHMIRAYLDTFREKGIETWIAHGTLLGWWWNGKILPWDWDLDVQVTGSTLDYLGKNLNRTMHHYVSEDTKVKREYLLDVNPFHWQRVRGDGNNVIDARWIDTSNGLFIDITGLSETEPDAHPGVLVCKNYHRYKTTSLYPMRESTFEGVPAKIPYSYDQILTDEYKNKALVVTEYEGHRWDTHVKNWVRLDQDAVDPHSSGRPKPHVPRSVQPRSTKAGIQNLFRLFDLS
ncbi:MAG: hypothetical protein M1833_001558 [Piccolia ochrophora]|nr:MAG: hypothetical protein M1833_001558 [Piccolia ochrophora]